MGHPIAILLRHGDYHQLPDTPSAHQPFPLSEAGELQSRRAVKLIASMVRDNGWTLSPTAHCSSLLRAWQTAMIVTEGLSSLDEIVQADELAERSLGSGANLSLAQLVQIVDQDPRYGRLPNGWKRDSHFRLPMLGAESLMSAGHRVADYISRQLTALTVEEDRAAAAVLFVGHGGAFRHAALQLGVLSSDEVASLSMHHGQPVAIALTDQGGWRTVAGHWKVRSEAERNLD